MRVTDAHVHIWAEAKSSRPEEAFFPLERLEEAMSEARVGRAVLVPTRWGYDDDATGANEYNFTAAEAQPHRFCVMALIDAERPDASIALSEMIERPGMKGLRLSLARARTEGMEWIWPEAVRLGMPVAFLASRGDLPQLVPIVERNPELSVLLDQAGVPAAGPDPFADLDQVLTLTKYKNVVVKLASLTKYSRDSYPFRDLHEPIRRLYDAFGPERLAWGSNYSTHTARATYGEVVDLFREELDFLSASDLDWIMDKTISRVLRWEQ